MSKTDLTFAVIIPCYRSQEVIQNTTQEILNLYAEPLKMNQKNLKLSRIILVDDGSNLETKKSLDELSNNEKIDLIKLNKNYGQHPAIFAGVLNSTEDFLITMDEDGEHNPNDINKMFAKLFDDNLDIIYADFKFKFINTRELLSKIAKKLIAFISGDKNIKYFSSFRLVKGDIFRTSAIYANNGAFLDIAIGWISKKIGTVASKKRKTIRRSTYNFKSLISHFGKLFFASGIKPLIFLFNFGWIISLISLIGVFYIIYQRFFNFIPVQGWVSNTVVLIFFGGVIISSLGLIARYISSIVETSSGKPFFTIKNNADE